MKFEESNRYPDLDAAIYTYRHTPVLGEENPALRDLEALIAERVTEARKQPLGSLVSYFAAQKEMFEQNPQVRSVYAEAEALARAFQAREPIQQRIARWLTETLSEESNEAGLGPLENREERAVRFVEEALELAQAIGVDRDQLHRLVDYVMNRPVGEVAQEVGGSMLTLYAVSAACGVDADAQAMKEVKRVETPEIRAKVRRRQKEKRAALVTNDVPRRGRDQLHWVSRADFEELQKRADELEKENERLRDRKHWVALEDVNELQNRADKVENENQRLRQGLDCGLDCEEHEAIELALAECAPTEEEREDYMQRAPSELPDLVKSWRVAAQQWSSIGFAIHRKLKDAGIAFTDPVGDIEDSLVARVATLIEQRDRAQKWLSDPILRIPEQLGAKENTVSLPRAQLSKLLAELDRQEAQVQQLQKRGTELVNEARDARNVAHEVCRERDKLKKQLEMSEQSWIGLRDKHVKETLDDLFNRTPVSCAMGKYCSEHEFTHGQEAEELREKLGQLCERLEKIPRERILQLLDKVDARDSLAYLEFRDEDEADDGDKLSAVDRISKKVAREFGGLFGPKPSWYEFPVSDFYTCHEDAERLYHTTVDDAVAERFDDYADGELEHLSEGCTVYCHVRLEPPTIDAGHAVDWLLEHLEESALEEFIDREGGIGDCWDTKTCKALRPRLEDLVQRMVSGMRVWSCKLVAAVELSPQQAEEILREMSPELFKQAGTK